MMDHKMRAIVTRGHGGPKVLRAEEIQRPEVRGNEVLVEVRAAGVNPVDWRIRRGDLRPLSFLMRRRVPGRDVDGVVAAVDDEVHGLAVGDRVYAMLDSVSGGGYAEYAVAGEDAVAAMPENLSFEEAAAVPLAASTALQGLRDHAHIEAGDSVLIVGASGGVGTFAVQIAKALGAEVTGVCSTRHVDMVFSLGADHVIDYTKADFTDGSRRYDVILQAAGAHTATACRRALTTNGTLVQISGTSDNRWIGPLGRIVTGRLLSPFVSQTITSFTVRPNRQDLEFIGSLIEAGKVTPVIDRTFPLTDIHDAIRHVEEGHTRGKVVVTVAARTTNIGSKEPTYS